MLQNITLVATQVFVLFILMGVGFVSNKIKLLNEKTVSEVTNFVLYIVTPCVIINSFSRTFDKAYLKGLIITFVASFLSFFLNILITKLIIHDKIKEKEKIARYGAVFSNSAYMAIPLQQALLGDDGVFYGAIYVAVFNIMNWTYGISLMSGDKKIISVKKIIFNPGIIGTFFGVLVFLMPFALPRVISKPIEYLAALNTPLPMIVIGYHLAESDFKIKGFWLYFSMAYRLIISPLLIMIILYLVGVEKITMLSITIALSAPFAATTSMFSEKFGGDTKLAAATVSLTTLITIITMPLVIGLAMNL